MSRVHEYIRSSKLFYPLAQLYHRIEQNIRITSSEYSAQLLTKRKTSLSTSKAIIDHVKQKIEMRGAKWPSLTEGKLKILLLTAANGWERTSLYSDLLRKFDVNYISLVESNITRGAGNITRNAVDRLLKDHFKNYSSRYDLILSYLSGAEIYPTTIEFLKSHSCPVFSFHWDDRLLFRGHKEDNIWSGPHSVARYYDLNLTNAPTSIAKYERIGASAIFWPEGGRLQDEITISEKDIPVLFIGTKYGIRESLVNYLKRSGIDIRAYGAGWQNGFVEDIEILRLIARAKIVLGVNYIGHSTVQCLKGRDFEIPLSSGLLLTSYHNDLEYVYEIDHDILVYTDFLDCKKKIERYLNNQDEADNIRINGHNRAMKSHTWCHRIEQILNNNCSQYK